jgi:hypothetical protein
VLFRSLTVGGGLSDIVRVLFSSGSNLYAGGNFSNGIKKWDGSSWSDLDKGLSNTVRTIASYKDNLYAAGDWTSNTGSYIAKWNGTTWNSIPFSSLPLSRSANIPGSIAVNNSSKFILFSHDKTPSGYPANNKLYDTLIFKSTGGSTWSDSITKLYYDIPDNTLNPITSPINSVPIDSLGRTFSITSSESPVSNINLTPYTFSTSTTDSNPGSGFIRLNSSFITQITEVYISNLNYLGINETEWYNTWDNNLQIGSPKFYGYLHINQQFSLKISSVTQQSGYYKISVFYSGTAPINPSVNITNNSQIGIDFSTKRLYKGFADDKFRPPPSFC